MTNQFKFFCLSLLLSAMAQSAHAQSAAELYDPEPPADSGYVRVIHAAAVGAVDVRVDGRPRVSRLGRGEASEYLVLQAGKHLLQLRPAGKDAALLSLPLDVAATHVVTLSFTALTAHAKPLVFEDRTTFNKLKAGLTVYHLHESLGTIDLLTADAALTVFQGVAGGASAMRLVNPIPITLMATKPGSKLSLGSTKISMTQGASYSILILPDASGKLKIGSIQNKIEGYTRK
jgi:alginate O-acetyltransferase complex protein AlgF